jgi:hypothetical protein
MHISGIVDKQWELKSQKDLENWVVTCDSDNGEGFSSCQLTLSPQSCGLFNGVLDLRVPKDGKMKRAGYCSIRTKRARVRFIIYNYLKKKKIITIVNMNHFTNSHLLFQYLFPSHPFLHIGKAIQFHAVWFWPRTVPVLWTLLYYKV